MIRKIFNLILGLPKTLYFNIKYLGVKNGIKLPVLISSKVKFLKLNGKIEISNFKTGIIKIGFTSCGILDYQYDRSLLSVEGVIRFQGKTSLGQGVKISLAKTGILEFGDNFSMTGGSQIICYKNIKFGNN